MRHRRHRSYRRVHAQIISDRTSCGAIGADARPNWNAGSICYALKCAS
jgi:hypothetical protein